MIILSDIWDKWAPKQAIVTCAERVGVSSTMLDVNQMQQEKFESAQHCIEEQASSSILSTPDSVISSPQNKRKGSVSYWKEKFDQAQSLIREMSEKSLQLEEIPGLLTFKKVKPNLTKNSVRVTQVHGSMRAKDVASKVCRRNKNAKRSSHLKKKKEEMVEMFIKCKDACTCKKRKCMAINRFKAVPKVQKHNSFSMQQTKLQSRWNKTCYDFASCHQTDNS